MTELTTLCGEIMEVKKFDEELSLRCNRVAEYGRVYLLAKKTKGCNGLGEIEALLEEYRKILYEVIGYCRRKKYINDLVIYDIDVTDQELEKLSMHLEAAHEKWVGGQSGVFT